MDGETSKEKALLQRNILRKEIKGAMVRGRKYHVQWSAGSGGNGVQ